MEEKITKKLAQQDLIEEINKLKQSDNPDDQELVAMIEKEFQEKIDKFDEDLKRLPRKLRRSLTPNNRFSERIKRNIGLKK